MPSAMPSSMPSSMPTLLSDFDRCSKYLVEADTILPIGRLNTLEYVKFITLYSRGRIDEDIFFDLPDDLKAEFQFSSTFDENGKLYIPTTLDSPEEVAQ
eukprot:776661-Ditylum_brightwellii.AAC.1